MGWDIERAIERNRLLLLRVVMNLFALVGIAEGDVVATLPRYLRIRVNRILRPAEAAVRRLVFVAARDLAATERTQRPVITTRATTKAGTGTCVVTRSVFLGLNGVPHPDALKKTPEGAVAAPVKPGPPALQLIDPLADPLAPPRRRYAKTLPRVTSLWSARQRPIPEIHDPAPDDNVSALGICRRLLALKRALDDLPREARRLARWRDRSESETAAGQFGRSSPIRPGPPPGHRKRPGHEVDELLRECHALAVYTRDRPDSS